MNIPANSPSSKTAFTTWNFTLPQELIDNVIDHLHFDKTTLRSCVLVSRQWVTSSRIHLFRELTIKSDSFSSTGSLALLEQTSTFSTYTRHLTLAGLDNGLPFLYHLRPSLPAPILGAILSQMPNVKSLTLQYLSFGEQTDSVKELSPIKQKRDLISLRLENIGTDDEQAKDLLDILDFFGTVKNVSVTDMMLNSESWKGSILDGHGGNKNLHIMSLSIGEQPSSFDHVGILKTFSWLPNVRSVQSLSLICGGHNETIALGRLISTTGDSLKNLDLHSLSSLSSVSWSGALSIHTLTKLESISLSCTMLSVFDVDIFNIAFDIFSLLTTNTLRHVTLFFGQYTIANPQQFDTQLDWTTFQNCLLRFSSLKTVTIKFDKVSPAEEAPLDLDVVYGHWCEHIRNSWPLLRDKGLLQFKRMSEIRKDPHTSTITV
ncbi:hypothetical protein C8Q75DRAFT_805134 [Abortiporus biennis]|nr:hypothetical protein C8Q75DRAFT_805134 [Abortiporus biennis]